ncbi:MAG: exonuclease domain-containing protein [Terrimesophilobacter sp.]
MTDLQSDNPWWHTLGVFDLETTGIDVATARIVSANLSVIGNTGEIVERLDWLADPGIEVPAAATAVHGISTERARNEGRPAADVVGEIVAAIRSLFSRGYALTVYNAPYDLTLLRHEATRHGIEPLDRPHPVIDPLVIDRAVDRYRKGKRTLETAATVYGVDLTDAHDAGADAIAAGRVAQALAVRFPAELNLLASELHAKQVEWSNQQSASFADYMRRTHNPDFIETSGWPER